VGGELLVCRPKLVAGEDRVSAWRQPEALQDLGAAMGRRIRAIRHQLGLPAVLAPVVLLAGLGVSYDETAAPGRQAFRCSQVPAREAAPLLTLLAGPIDVEHSAATAQLEPADHWGVADSHANDRCSARQSKSTQRGVAQGFQVFLPHRRQVAELHPRCWSGRVE